MRDSASSRSSSLAHSRTYDPDVILLERFEIRPDDQQPLNLEHTASPGPERASASPMTHPSPTHSTTQGPYRPTNLSALPYQGTLPSSTGGRLNFQQHQGQYGFSQPIYPSRQQQQPRQVSPRHFPSQPHSSQTAGYPSEQYSLPYASNVPPGYASIPFRPSASAPQPPHLPPNLASRYSQLPNQWQNQPSGPITSNVRGPAPQQQDWLSEGYPSQDPRFHRHGYPRGRS